MTSNSRPQKRAIVWIAVSSQGQASDDRISLTEQERIIREYCDTNGYSVIDVLRVPGHSRSESDIITAMEELAAQGCYAYHQLRSYWRSKSFDLLIAFDNSRFARSQSLHSFVIENTIRAGAIVHLIQGGSITADNMEMGIAMGGIAATAGIKRLTHMYKAGMRRRMERGLSMNRIPDSHRLVYDDRGKPLRLEVNSDNLFMYEDAAALLLEGAAWLGFGKLMASRFGYYSPRSGKPYSGSYFYRLFHNPYSWGHAARNFVLRYGVWAFDATAPLPEGAEIERNPNPPIPPLWTGQLAENIKAELTRRTNVVGGNARPHNTYKFTGLMVCDECGGSMSIALSERKRHTVVYWSCPNAKSSDLRQYRPCTQHKFLRDDRAQTQIRAFFSVLAERGVFDITTLHARDKVDHQARATQIRKEIDELNKHINVLILQKTIAPPNVVGNYTMLIQQASERMTALQRAHIEAVSLASNEVSSQRKAATSSIFEQGETFWQKPSVVINQTLHKALGKARFYVRDGDIIDVK